MFKYNLDAKISSWKRYKFVIEADDRAQADEQMKQIVRGHYDLNALELNESCMDAADIPYSEEFLLLEDNKGEPTIEVFYEDLDSYLIEYIYDNKQHEEQ